MNPLFAIFGLGWGELVVIGIIAVLLFGRKLPDMAKYLGKSVVQFKQGMHGLEGGFDDITNPTTTGATSTAVQAEPVRPPQRVAPAAPKFDDSPPSTSVTANPPQP
jgi:sec-independent protein translocase protein TatA